MEYLPALLDNLGVENVSLARIYVAGCSLERHISMYNNDEAAYQYYRSEAGRNRWVKAARNVSLRQALADGEWDIVVMQQASGLNLVDFATGVMCFSYAGMLGVFVTALYTERGSTKSVIAALAAGLVTVLLMQPYIMGPLTELLTGSRFVIAWPWWAPIGGAASTLVCLTGKPRKKLPQYARLGQD